MPAKAILSQKRQQEGKANLKRGRGLALVVADDEGPSQDELLALFRAKRQEKAAQAHKANDADLAAALQPGASKPAANAPPEPSVPVAATPAPSAPHLRASAPAAPLAPSSAAWAPAPTPAPLADAALAQAVAAFPVPPSAPSRAVALRPASAAGRSLAAAGPVLKLSERLLEDAHLTVRGSRVGRRVGIILIALGFLALAVERRFSLVAGANYQVLIAGRIFNAYYAPAALVALGVILLALFLFVPPSRRLAVRLAASQKEEWERIQGEMKAARFASAFATGLSLLGPILLAAAYVVPYGLARLGALALGSLALAVGLVLGVRASARRNAVQRLYVQTMILARLEGSGLGPAGEGGGAGAVDPRVGQVLKALDQLLGALPESAVRQFLSSPQSQDYLDLIEEAGDRNG